MNNIYNFFNGTKSNEKKENKTYQIYYPKDYHVKDNKLTCILCNKMFTNEHKCSLRN